ncbi:MAG: hypothetical protein H6718_30055 [Polyangiaceae bacterium]|nr:hypothetical protein [Polyangiaceae bacterium]
MSSVLSLEKFAVVSARLDAGMPRDGVLKEAGLTQQQWEEELVTWLTHLSDQIQRQNYELYQRYTQWFLQNRLDAERQLGLQSAPAVAAPREARRNESGDWEYLRWQQQAAGTAPSAPPTGAAPPAMVQPPAIVSSGIPPMPASGGVPPMPASGGVPPMPASGGVPPMPASAGVPPMPAYSVPPMPTISGVPPMPGAVPPMPGAAPSGVPPMPGAVPPIPASAPPSADVPPLPSSGAVAPPPMVSPVPSAAAPAEPPMIGAVSAPGNVAAAGGFFVSQPPSATSAAPPSAEPAPPITNIPQLSLGDYAMLAAEIVVMPEQVERALAKYGIGDSRVWQAIQQDWEQRLRSDGYEMENYQERFESAKRHWRSVYKR